MGGKGLPGRQEASAGKYIMLSLFQEDRELSKLQYSSAKSPSMIELGALDLSATSLGHNV